MTRWKQGVPSLAEYRDRDYGVAFEAPAFALEHIFRLRDSRDIYMFRHLLTFLVYFGGVCAVFRLAQRRFLDWRTGLLSALFLILTPRFFAESFYNSKDIVFMAVFAAAMNTTISFVLQPRVKTALIHALATAVAIDVRIMALLLVAVSVMFLSIRVMRRELRLGRTCLLFT
jgi:4-amino-4-deoxy-L-arabinose transferase-like glycosyltransferase